MYQVLARKWRPQNFEELVGQQHVATTLANAVEADRLAHAYLFAGLRGTGKTTVARILAKCLNCEKGPTTKPCGTCAPCQEIAESRAIDVLEIDAASRTKVEQTRELLEMVSYAPVRDRHRVLIIDEAHMLSKASFNALLKTLEEPPPNVVFVLATTELQKILPTILSRCQVFEFRRVPPKELTGYLRRLSDAESFEVTDRTLDRIARAGEGSVRDALSVLERILAFCGTKIDDDDVIRLLGTVRAEVLTEMLQALANREASAMLQTLDRLVDEGHDLLHFWGALIAALRDVLLEQAMPDQPELLARPVEEARALSAAAAGLTREDLVRAFQLLADLEPGLKSSSQPRFLFEAALVRLASLGAVRPIEEILQSFDDDAPELRSEPARKRPATSRGASAQQKKNPEPAAVATPAPRAAAGTPPNLLARSVDDLQASKPMVAAILEQAASLSVGDGRSVLRFAADNESLIQPLQRDDCRALLEQQLAGLVGQPVKLSVELIGAAPAPSSGADPPRSVAPPPPPAAKKATPESLLKQARQEPGVKQLLREFGAQVVDIRPMSGLPRVESEQIGGAWEDPQ